MNSFEAVAAGNQAYRIIQSGPPPEAAGTLAHIITNVAPVYRRVASEVCRELVALTDDDPDYSGPDYYRATYDVLADVEPEATLAEISRRALRRLYTQPTGAELVADRIASAPPDDPEVAAALTTEANTGEATPAGGAFETDTQKTNDPAIPPESIPKISKKQLIQADYELCQRVTNGDPQAQEQFIAQYYRLLRKYANAVAERLKTGSMSAEDLFQEVVIYALEQAEKYRPDTGARFSTYVSSFIFPYLSKVVYKQYGVKIPEHLQGTLSKIEKLNTHRLGQQRGAMTNASIEREFGIPVGPPAAGGQLTTGNIQLAMQLTRYMGSLENGFSPREPGSPTEPYILDERNALSSVFDTEPVNADEAIIQKELEVKLAEILGTLSEREAGIVRLRFGFNGDTPKTFDEIGAVYGVTRERVRVILDKTLEKIRKPARASQLRPYFYDYEPRLPLPRLASKAPAAEDLERAAPKGISGLKAGGQIGGRLAQKCQKTASP